MMKIEEVVGDLILLILDNHEPLKKIGIDQDKIFVQVKGYDENGMWIHHPGFQVPDFNNEKEGGTQKVVAVARHCTIRNYLVCLPRASDNPQRGFKG